MEDRVEYKGFYIDRTETGYRVCRIEDSNIHTHLRNLNPCYKLIDNVNRDKIPRRCSAYYLTSHMRLSHNKDYKKKIEQMLSVRAKKTHQNFYNKSGFNKRK